MVWGQFLDYFSFDFIHNVFGYREVNDIRLFWYTVFAKGVMGKFVGRVYKKILLIAVF